MTYEEAINATGLVSLFQYSNRVTNDIFVIMLLITVYLVPFIYLLLRNHTWEEASMTAGFFAVITAIILRVAEISTVERYVFFAIATIIVPLVIVFLKDRST